MRRFVKSHVAWLWRPQTPLEKWCMSLIWGALLFSILCNFAVGSARADEPDAPAVYDVEVFEKTCPESDSSSQQYEEVVAIAGLCEVFVERFDALGLVLDDQKIGNRLQAIRQGIPITNEDPLAVAEQEPVSLEMTEEAVTAAGAAQKEAIWAFAGVAIGLFFGYGLYRQVLARG